MMGASGYKTKKELKAAVGERLSYRETSLFGEEYKADGTFCIVGPCAYTNRKWFAEVTMEHNLIVRVT